MALRGGSLSRSLIAIARTFPSRSSISPIRRPTSPLQPYLFDSPRPFFTVTRGLLGCTESLLPLHSAIADTHRTSHISFESRAFCHLSQGT
ncbi:hypothetical protein QN277_003287 [Acacia crassicarpa]|uniref:Uncharacterized protein n=1 Tax=Acacia crassicarpa TaxID=499986 RepID=A0AAE1J0B9_9FABA|nr:hypothetical protein QN277_003287 [Acacia crassicarpa]